MALAFHPHRSPPAGSLLLAISLLVACESGESNVSQSPAAQGGESNSAGASNTGAAGGTKGGSGGSSSGTSGQSGAGGSGGDKQTGQAGQAGDGGSPAGAAGAVSSGGTSTEGAGAGGMGTAGTGSAGEGEGGSAGGAGGPEEVWNQASLTWFESYPDPGSPECVEFNGCTWAGQFAALDGKQSEQWVKDHNIAAIHSKDFETYKLKTLRLRKDGHEIDVTVYDMCADSDCSGCCTENAKPSGFLIDVEKYTAERFGVEIDGQVEWRCLDCN